MYQSGPASVTRGQKKLRGKGAGETTRTPAGAARGQVGLEAKEE